MDEKAALGLKTLKKQMDAHLAKVVGAHIEAAAPKAQQMATLVSTTAAPSAFAVAPHVSAVVQAVQADGFCGTWDKCYPWLRMLLSGASWFVPGPYVPLLKGLAETLDSQFVHGDENSLCGPKK